MFSFKNSNAFRTILNYSAVISFESYEKKIQKRLKLYKVEKNITMKFIATKYYCYYDVINIH